jgi:two-component system cell cycle response regulator
MSALLELTERLTEARPLEDSLRAVTDAALDLLPATHASIRLLDGSHSELLSGARSGAGLHAQPMSFRRGQGLIGWVVQYKEALCIDDVAKDPRFVTGKQGFAIRSMIAEPLWSAGNVIGVLSVSSPKRRAFRQSDQLLARLLANCCTPPIERARLRRLAMTDDLTLAYNQRYLSPRVNEELERARRSGQPLSLLMLDLDHFKNVNDRHGHDVGDMVLRLFADRVRSIVRRVDVFIRRGGEEFLLLMPATALEQARNTAERIRRTVGGSDIDVGGGKHVRQTVSIGVACWDFKESPEALQRRADVAMYAAKEQGRDRVVASAPPPSLLRMVK